MTLLHAIRPGSADALLADLVEQFIDRLQSGDPIDPAAFAAEHPEQTGALLALLPAAAAMADLRRSSLRGATHPGPDSRLEGGILGEYRIVREVGRGGMGVVYEAERAAPGRRVAIKVLPSAAAMDPTQLARFRVETQVVAAMHHPHIVPILDSGCERGVHYYAMQFIEGRSLAGVIADRRADVPKATCHREAARLALQAAEALDHAHALGILHRDVKPANLLIDPTGHLWVADFGLARFLGGDALTRTGDLVGTLRYLSPEQAAGRRVLDPRSDIYSLGATLYEFLTLRPAFDGLDRQDLLRQVALDEPVAARKVDPSIPRDLETILSRAMAKEADARYASAAGLADDLRRFLDGRPIVARRPGPAEHAARWARRHRGAVATGAIVLAMVVAGLAVGSALLWREQVRTRNNLRVALIALDEFCLSTSGMEFARDPERMQEIQEFQLKALSIYERVLRQNPGDPEARRAAFRANHRVANILAESPRFNEAGPIYRTADAHLNALRADTPDDPRLAAESADLLGDWGAALAGRDLEAQALLRRALGAHTRLATRTHLDDRHRRSVARDSLNLSRTIGITRPGDADEKEGLQRRAVGLRRSLRDSSFASRSDLAEALGYLGHLLNVTGRPDEGAETFREARTLTRSMETEFRAEPTYRRKLGILESLFAFPRYCGAPLNPDETLRACRSALDVRARLVAEFPFVPDFRAELAWSHYSLSGLLKNLDRGPEAEAEGRRSLEVFEGLIKDHPTVNTYRSWATIACEGLGIQVAASDHPGDARRFLARAIELSPENDRLRGRVSRALASLPADATGK